MPKFLSKSDAREALASLRQSPEYYSHPMRTARDLGESLRHRREALGYTVEEVAVSIDILPKSVVEMESGNEAFGLNYWIRLAMVLGVDLFSIERVSECT